jgi:antitoxin component of RelBE/YafQ-DinJ toxin-antitoxin module
MDKKQVLIRVSDETYQRLQSLADKYGLSASGLIVSLVNERWLQERSIPAEVKPNSTRPKVPDTFLTDGPPLWDDDPPPIFHKQEITAPIKSARKRHKPKR